MPLLRQSLYSQNVNLYLAPTADGRNTWLPLLRTIACEGRCAVLSSNQCIKESNLPSWITGEDSERLKRKPTTNGITMPPRLRRKSIITEDGYEIALPEAQSSISPIEEELQEEDRLRKSKLDTNWTPIPPRLRGKSTITDDGNEIALPEAKGSMSAIEEAPNESKSDEFASHGGSCIISPMGDILAGPLWDDDNGLLTYDVDFDDCLRGRLDLDVGGSYSRYGFEPLHLKFNTLTSSRNDSFKLTVEGLDLSPPP
jgi:nitrilase